MDGCTLIKFCRPIQQKRVSANQHCPYMEGKGKLCTCGVFFIPIPLQFIFYTECWGCCNCFARVKNLLTNLWSIGYFSMLSNNAVFNSAKYTWIFQRDSFVGYCRWAGRSSLLLPTQQCSRGSEPPRTPWEMAYLLSRKHPITWSLIRYSQYLGFLSHLSCL